MGAVLAQLLKESCLKIQSTAKYCIVQSTDRYSSPFCQKSRSRARSIDYQLFYQKRAQLVLIPGFQHSSQVAAATGRQNNTLFQILSSKKRTELMTAEMVRASSGAGTSSEL